MAKKATKELTEQQGGNAMLVRPGEIESWDEFEITSVNIVSTYWTPKQIGEVRCGIYHGVHDRECPDFNDPTVTQVLPNVVFHDPVGDEVFTNASKILLDAMKAVSIGTPIRIEYAGKIRSKKGNQCDDWKVNRLGRKESAK